MFSRKAQEPLPQENDVDRFRHALELFRQGRLGWKAPKPEPLPPAAYQPRRRKGKRTKITLAHLDAVRNQAVTPEERPEPPKVRTDGKKIVWKTTPAGRVAVLVDA